MIILVLVVLRGSFFGADLGVQSMIAFRTNLLDKRKQGVRGEPLIQGQQLAPRGVYQVRSCEGKPISRGHTTHMLNHLQGTGGEEVDHPGLGHVHFQDLDVGFCPWSRTKFELA